VLEDVKNRIMQRMRNDPKATPTEIQREFNLDFRTVAREFNEDPVWASRIATLWGLIY